MIIQVGKSGLYSVVELFCEFWHFQLLLALPMMGVQRHVVDHQPWGSSSGCFRVRFQVVDGDIPFKLQEMT